MHASVGGAGCACVASCMVSVLSHPEHSARCAPFPVGVGHWGRRGDGLRNCVRRGGIARISYSVGGSLPLGWFRVAALSPWLYLDADGFFASCEEAADPALHGRAVGVVAGSAYADAPLIAVNTVAKRAGVRSGDRVRDAREHCAGFVVRPQRVERYVEIHERMVCAVGAVLPVAAVHSIDELSAQLSPRDDARSVVERVKRSVACALSPLVPVSVGVAPSAWLAKCAAEANKPNAAVVWRPDDLPAVYAELKLEDLPGAGPRICARLRAAGLTTVEAIHGASRSRIIAAWGSIEGERVRLALRGEDVSARVSRRRSVAHGRVLTGRDRCWREARLIVRWLGVCALHRCATGGQRPGRLRLEVVTVGGALRGGVGRLDGQECERDLLCAVSTLCDEAAASGSDDPPGRVGLVLEALCDRSAASLFEADPRERRLQWMLDRVRDRYGARALLWGEWADPRGPYTGAKIGYQSFPDMARLRWLGLIGEPMGACPAHGVQGPAGP